MSDDTDRLKTRRLFAYVAFWISTAYGVLGLVSPLSDELTQRLVAGWGPNATIFAGFIGYVCWYVKVGSDETKHAMEMKQGDER